jgi:hypothetical protein
MRRVARRLDAMYNQRAELHHMWQKSHTSVAGSGATTRLIPRGSSTQYTRRFEHAIAELKLHM